MKHVMGTVELAALHIHALRHSSTRQTSVLKPQHSFPRYHTSKSLSLFHRPQYPASSRNTAFKSQYAIRRSYTTSKPDHKPTPYATSTPSNDPHAHTHTFRIYQSVPPLRSYRTQLFLQSQSIAFVPTMGALHQGHLTLIRAAAAEYPHVFVSIFVNPTQFGPKEDLSTYPRTWEEDLEKLEKLNKELSFPNSAVGRISAVFAPSVKTMYPSPSSESTTVTVPALSRKLEGRSRPSFLLGVATVCTKLFNIVQPNAVYFGQKDIQQSMVIRRFVQDLYIPTSVRVVATSREAGDGLALSSRNVHLGPRRRAIAGILYKALKDGEQLCRSGTNDADEIVRAVEETLNQELLKQKALAPAGRALFEVDYVALTDLEEMDEVAGMIDMEKGAALSLAVKMLPVEEPKDEQERNQQVVRLIDNVILERGNIDG